MRRVLLCLAALVCSLLATAPAATADDSWPPPNWSGEVLFGNLYYYSGHPAVYDNGSVCHPDGTSVLHVFYSGGGVSGGYNGNGPLTGQSESVLDITVGPQTTQADGAVRGPVLAINGSYLLHTLVPSQIPSDVRGTFSLPTAGSSDETLGDVPQLAGCTTASADDGTEYVNTIDIDTLAGYTAYAHDANTVHPAESHGELWVAPGGLADLSAAYSLAEPTSNRYTTTFGTTADFAPSPPLPAATVTGMSDPVRNYVGYTSTLWVTAQSADYTVADHVRALVTTAGATPSTSSCLLVWGHCYVDITGPAQAGTSTSTVCVDNDADSVCDHGEPSSTTTVEWISDTAPTPTGANVQVTTTSSGVALTFGSVTSAGDTTATQISPVHPESADFNASGDPPVYFDITTTASFSGPVEVCIPVPSDNFSQADYEAQRLYHYTGDAWHDITTHVSYTTATICGSTTSFSPFAVGTPTRPGDLAISRPADVTVPATASSGTKVSYLTPVVTGSAGHPAPVCSKASGSLFPIGTTSVTCTATDSGYANSPQATTFQVTVQGAGAQLVDLHTAVLGVGSGTSLKKEVELTQALYAAGATHAACVGLGVFAVDVAVQTLTRKVAAAKAVQLLATSARIGSVMRC